MVGLSHWLRVSPNSSVRRGVASRLRGLAVTGAVTALALVSFLIAPAHAGAAAAGQLTADPQPLPGVFLYQDVSYGGRAIRLTGSTTYVGSAFNDITSSVYVVGSYRVTLYADANYGGARTTIGPRQCEWIGNHAAPFGDWPGPPSCPTEFPSPAEIGNDVVSSVAITTKDTYSLSTRLVSPAGMWIAASPTSSIAWHFYPDGTYAFSYHDTAGLTQIGGRFTLRDTLVWGTSWVPVIGTSNNGRYVNGSYAGPEPDKSYGYQYLNGGNTINVLNGNWQQFAFTPQ